MTSTLTIIIFEHSLANNKKRITIQIQKINFNLIQFVYFDLKKISLQFKWIREFFFLSDNNVVIYTINCLALLSSLDLC